MIKALKGRIIAELIPKDKVERKSGLIVINRKAITCVATVISVGDPTQTKKGKPMFSPANVGDVIYFRKYKPMIHSGAKDGLKKGKITIWFSDVILVETKEV